MTRLDPFVDFSPAKGAFRANIHPCECLNLSLDLVAENQKMESEKGHRKAKCANREWVA